MKKEFTIGDYCRFPNEQIPRILDILRVNGHNVYESDANYQDGMNVVLCSSDGDFIGYWSKHFVDKKTELTPHDFLVIALRLEEGMGMRSDESTPEQRRHILNSLDELHIHKSANAQTDDVNTMGISFGGLYMYATEEKISHIPYIEWCRRLCVEPIESTVEKSLEQHVDEYDAGKFDPMKPFEVKAKSSEHWNRYEGWRYVSFDEVRKVHIFYCESSHGYVAADCVRNIEFNASMLEVGEWMVVSDPDWLSCDGILVVKALSGRVFYPESGEEIFQSENIKGRKVIVEHKIVE